MRNCLHKCSAETAEKLEFCQPGQVKGLDSCVEVFIDGENPQEFLIARFNAISDAMCYGILCDWFFCSSR